MKRPTVFLGEMTSPEVEAFLRRSQTVIVPTGSTEQPGREQQGKQARLMKARRALPLGPREH